MKKLLLILIIAISNVNVWGQTLSEDGFTIPDVEFSFCNGIISDLYVNSSYSYSEYYWAARENFGTMISISIGSGFIEEPISIENLVYSEENSAWVIWVSTSYFGDEMFPVYIRTNDESCNELYIHSTNGKMTLCNGYNDIQLDVRDSFGSIFNWYKNDTILSNSSNIYLVEEPGVYYVQVCNSFGDTCLTSDIYSVIGEPIVQMPEVTDYCFFDSIKPIISVSSGMSPYEIVYQKNRHRDTTELFDSIYTFDQNVGSYEILYVQDQLGCRSGSLEIDNITIIKPIINNWDDPIVSWGANSCLESDTVYIPLSVYLYSGISYEGVPGEIFWLDPETKEILAEGVDYILSDYELGNGNILVYGVDENGCVSDTLDIDYSLNLIPDTKLIGADKVCRNSLDENYFVEYPPSAMVDWILISTQNTAVHSFERGGIEIDWLYPGIDTLVVRVISPEGCMSVDSMDILVMEEEDCILDIAENMQSEITLKENPLVQDFDIIAEKEIAQISVFDMQGRILYRGEYNNFDPNCISAGQYSLNVLFKDESYGTLLFVKK